VKSEHKDKLADDDMKTLNEAVDEAKKAVKDEKADKDALESAAKALNDKIMPIGAKMYESAKSEDTPKSEDSDAKPDDKKSDDPIEGEVVDDKKE
jgi:molecular chaperone DnaK